jgi:hypothetical protein
MSGDQITNPFPRHPLVPLGWSECTEDQKPLVAIGLSASMVLLTRVLTCNLIHTSSLASS